MLSKPSKAGAGDPGREIREGPFSPVIPSERPARSIRPADRRRSLRCEAPSATNGTGPATGAGRGAGNGEPAFRFATRSSWDPPSVLCLVERVCTIPLKNQKAMSLRRPTAMQGIKKPWGDGFAAHGMKLQGDASASDSEPPAAGHTATTKIRHERGHSRTTSCCCFVAGARRNAATESDCAADPPREPAVETVYHHDLFHGQCVLRPRLQGGARSLRALSRIACA